MSNESKITLISYDMFVMHPDRKFFSSYCSKTQHKNCKGIVRKSRCESGRCPCPCHKIKDDVK